MKSLAEQLGGLLSDLPNDAQGEELGGDSDAVRDVVLGAISEETGLSAEEIDLQDTLDSQLSLFGLPLWSVVAQVEHELKVQFEDQQISAWETVADVLEAARAAKRQ